MIDLIGDIHGHADELEELLKKMGYTETNGVYSHPERKVLFVGDYIDRGKQIVRTLEIVKAMADTGNAIALMGNHEYNALCFHFHKDSGGHLRKHSIKNIIQHYKTLEQFQNNQKDYEYYIDWFMDLPLYYETEEFRAVHACWDNKNIEYLRKNLVNDRLNKELLRKSVDESSDLFNAIDQTLKGKEIDMPNVFSFTDKDGTIRTKMRIKWWENPKEMTYKSISIVDIDDLPDKLIDFSYNYYKEDEKKVFFGHYWLTGDPVLQKKNVCCLDYSVAKGEKLVAYRLNGEKILDENNFVCV